MRQNISIYSPHNTLTGFEEVVINNETTYYVINQSFVILYDHNWTFKSTFEMPNMFCACLKYVFGHLYITSNFGLYKTNSTFKLISSNKNGSEGVNANYYYYRGIDYYDSLLYVGSWGKNFIDVFNTNLEYVNKIQIRYKPFSINHFNGMIYVGCSYFVFVIQNNTVTNVNEFPDCQRIYSIYFDIYGYMALTCNHNNIAMLYNYKGDNLQMNISTFKNPMQLTVDSLGRLIVLSSNKISIFY